MFIILIQLCCILFLFCISMIGTLFPLPRILYSMASDGLLFEIFSKVDSNKKTPFWGTLICGIFTGKYTKNKITLYFVVVLYSIIFTSLVVQM